ncbi:hypothetical protein SELMODRAFT_414636 [Selaginella moellendorffii]|uniref:Legume lectin domain-containing protein n=1 Tax=Selaginella moellendorffii TaxID=88036 RepID=D8RTF4_SELML|nr:hypothetical protein SELMODRAFT_414636 [Selaginella moellendorffii]
MVLPAAIVCLFFVVLVLAICNQQGHPVLFPVVANTRAASSVRKAALPRDQHTGSDLDQQAHLEDDFFSLAPDISENSHTHFPAVAGKNVDRERQDRVTPSTPLTAPPSPMLAVTPSPLLSPAWEGNHPTSNFSWKQDNDDGDNQTSLESTLTSASMENKTILVTELNKAWAVGGMFDLFLRSFHTGEGILHLLDHLLVATLDREASAESREIDFQFTVPECSM